MDLHTVGGSIQHSVREAKVLSIRSIVRNTRGQLATAAYMVHCSLFAVRQQQQQQGLLNQGNNMLDTATAAVNCTAA